MVLLYRGLERLEQDRSLVTTNATFFALTDLDQSVVAVNHTANQPSRNYFVSRQTIPLPTNTTADIASEAIPSSVAGDLYHQHYPLSAVAPLYQRAVFNEIFSVAMLTAGAAFNATNGVDLDSLPDWLQFDFASKNSLVHQQDWCVVNIQLTCWLMISISNSGVIR